MGERLKTVAGNVDWMGPMSRAAARVAETGQIEGQGQAALMGGIAEGLSALGGGIRRKRERTENFAREDARLAEEKARFALTRQDAMEERQARTDLALLSRLDDEGRALEGDASAITMASSLSPELVTDDLRQRAAYLDSELSKNRQHKEIVTARLFNSRYTQRATAQRAPGETATAWAPGQSPSEKAARGEPTGDPDVYWNERDYAESDAAQASSGRPAPAPMAAAPVQGGMVNDGGVMGGDGQPTASPIEAQIAEIDGEMGELRKRIAKRQAAMQVLASSRNVKVSDAVAAAAMSGADSKRLNILMGQRALLLKKYESDMKQTAEAEAEARKRAAEAAELPDLRADAELLGAPQGLKTKKGVEAAFARAKQDDAQAFKEQQGEAFRLEREKRDLRRRSWAVEDRDIKEGRMNAKDAATMAQRDVVEAGHVVKRAQDQLKALNDSFRANKATKEELIEAANDLADAKDFYDQAVKRRDGIGGAAPQAATTSPTADPKASASAEFKALPKEQQTLEVWTAIKAKHGIK